MGRAKTARHPQHVVVEAGGVLILYSVNGGNPSSTRNSTFSSCVASRFVMLVNMARYASYAASFAEGTFSRLSSAIVSSWINLPYRQAQGEGEGAGETTCLGKTAVLVFSILEDAA
jgi:hypothetical protein